MFSIMNGRVLAIAPTQLILQIAGIGYAVDMPLSHLANITLNQELLLYVHVLIREDAHTLYGFINQTARDCFRQLLRVSGIGPRIALALLSTLDVQQIQGAILTADINLLCLTPGVGKKMAERMCLELAGKIHSPVDHNSQQPYSNHIQSDLIQALTSLGYATKDIAWAIKSLPDITDLHYAIREALKLLSSHRS
jgi:holliday junction DNA helicase RuvA